jgi:hypothetical protein
MVIIMLEVGKSYRYIHRDGWARITRQEVGQYGVYFVSDVDHYLPDGRRAPLGELRLDYEPHRLTDLLVELPQPTEEDLLSLL